MFTSCIKHKRVLYNVYIPSNKYNIFNIPSIQFLLHLHKLSSKNI